MRLQLKGEGGIGHGYHLFLDDEEVTHAKGVVLSVDVNQMNQAIVTYACDMVDVDGDFEVRHRCGLEKS